MASPYASGKNSIAECDRCGFRYKLKQLKRLVVKTKNISVLVCPTCWEPDHPQLLLGMFPVNDPQAVRNPRPDRSYVAAGVLGDGFPSQGSRQIQWGWNPVGGATSFVSSLTPNNLVSSIELGEVTVVTT